MQIGPISHTVSKWQPSKTLIGFHGHFWASHTVQEDGIQCPVRSCVQLLTTSVGTRTVPRREKVLLSEKGRWYEDKQKQQVSTLDSNCVYVCVCVRAPVCMCKISKSHSSHYSPSLSHSLTLSETLVLTHF